MLQRAHLIRRGNGPNMKSGKYSKGGRIDKMARSKTEFSYFRRKLPLQNLRTNQNKNIDSSLDAQRPVHLSLESEVKDLRRIHLLGQLQYLRVRDQLFFDFFIGGNPGARERQFSAQRSVA